MQVFSRIDEFDPGAPTAVSVGVFDGFHLGHARVAEELKAAAREHSARSCIVTFTTHPRKVLGREPFDLVTSLEHRLLFLERAGVDLVLKLEFTPELAALSAGGFLKGVVIGKLRARALVVGCDSRMGAGAEADAEGIRELGRGMGLDVRVVGPVTVLGGAVSSTGVREAIHAGDLETAAALLGRRVSVLGTVVRGEGRGRTLGFPTANINVHREVRPPWGVYATRARVVRSVGGSVAGSAGGRPERADEKWLPSATNVGPRPTFDRPADDVPTDGRRPDLLIETHLLAPPASMLHDRLYGRTIEVEFVEKLRDERRFVTDRRLSEQIARDVEATREVLAAGGLL